MYSFYIPSSEGSKVPRFQGSKVHFFSKIILDPTTRVVARGVAVTRDHESTVFGVVGCIPSTFLLRKVPRFQGSKVPRFIFFRKSFWIPRHE